METSYDAKTDAYFLKMQELLDFADRSNCTKKAYTTYTVPFINYCHDVLNKDPGMVTHDEIRGFLNTLQNDRGLSNRTMNHAISELKFLLTSSGFGWDDMQVPHKNFTSPVLYVPDRSRIEELINSIDSLKKKAMVTIMYSAGTRVSETCTLKCKDIHLKDGYIHIDDGKGGKGRNVPLAPITAEVIKKYWVSLPSEKKTRDWLFTQDRNISKHADPEYIQKFLKSHCERMGWEQAITPHTLRRAFATHLYLDGYTIETISRLMGHASTTSTMIYVILAEAMLAQSVKSPIDRLQIVL